MSRHATRWTAAAAAALLTSLGLVVATPAQGDGAGPSVQHRAAGKVADLSWLEVGTLPGVAGNMHLGSLWVQVDSTGQTYVWGYVDDLQCDDGFVPEGPGGGHGGEENFPCRSAGSRVIDGGALTVVLDKRFATGRLTGTLQVTDPSYRFSSVRRDATIEGRIGPMVFDDEAGEFSHASMGTYREGFRQRIR